MNKKKNEKAQVPEERSHTHAVSYFPSFLYGLATYFRWRIGIYQKFSGLKLQRKRDGKVKRKDLYSNSCVISQSPDSHSDYTTRNVCVRERKDGG